MSLESSIHGLVYGVIVLGIRVRRFSAGFGIAGPGELA